MIKQRSFVNNNNNTSMNNKENNAVISNMESENLDEHDERQFSYGKMPNCLPAPSQTSGQILANKNNGYANNNNTSLNCIADNKKTLLTQKSLPSEDSNNYGNKCYESINSQDGKAYPSSGSNHSSNGSNSNGNSTSCSITAQRLLKDVKDLALKNQKTEQSLRELQRKINLQKTKKTRNQQDDKENLAAITGDKKLSRNNSQQNQPYSSYNENYTSSYSTNNTSVNNAGSSNNTNSLNNANYNKGQQYQQQQQGASILTQNSNYQNIYHKHSQGTTNSTNANELNANANGYQKNKIPILNYKSQHDQLKQQQASSDYLHQLKVIQQQEQQKQQAQQLQLQQLQQIQQQKQQAQQIQQQQLQKQQQLLQQQQQAKKNTTKARFVEKNFSDQQLDKMNNNRNLNQKENVFRQHENLYQQQVQQQKLKELQLRDDESHKIKQVEHTFLQQQAIQQQQLQAQFDQYQTHSSKRDEHVDRVMREETISSKLARLIINQNYSQEILQYITANEDKFCPQNCLQNHGITVSLRAKMVDWMIEVMKSYHCSEESYFMAVRLMDTFLEKSKTRKEPSDLHLIGVTCIFVACKYEEIYPLRLEVTSDKIAHRKLSPEQIKECEAEILTTLDFNLLGTSPYEITMHTLTLIGLQDRLQNSEFQYSHKICLYLCKMVLYDYDFFRKIPYSLMSAALIYISFKIISQFEQEFFAEAYIKPVIQVLKVETKQLIEVSTRILSLAKSFDQYFPDLKNLKKFNGFEPTSYEIDEIKKIQLKKEDKSKREEQKRNDSNYEQMSEELKDEMRDEKEELSLKDDLKEQMKEELKDETE